MEFKLQTIFFLNWPGRNLQIINFFGNLKILCLNCNKLNFNFSTTCWIKNDTKTEIMAFAFLPWLIFIILTYKQTNQKKYLMMALPLMAILLSLKSSITLMIGFTVLIFFGKEALKKDIILLGTGSVVLMSLLIFESFQFTNILIWDHKTPLAYDF